METTLTTHKVENGKPFYIAPICDLQYTGKNGSLASDLFREYLSEASLLNAHYIGLGDYIDFMSPSNRSRMAQAALYDTAASVIEEKSKELIQDLFIDYLYHTHGKWLGLLHGHHWSMVSATQTSDQWLAERLGCPYLGTSAYVALDFVSDDSSDRKGRVVLWIHHGTGNGRAAAPVNKLERVATYWDADVYVIGHMSKLASAAIERIYPVNGEDGLELRHRKSLLVGAGSWSRAYMKGHTKGGRPHGCYVEEAMMDPAHLGGAFIKIVPRWVARRWDPIIRVEL